MERSVSGGGSGGTEGTDAAGSEKGGSPQRVLLLTERRKDKASARFTEAALLSAMENPVKYMESGDRGLAKTLGETGGLGTVATRADIIEKLFSSFLLEKKGQEIYLTAKARQLLELVPEDLKETGADSGVGTEAFGDGERKLKEGCFHEADPGLYPGTSGGNPDRRGHFSS